MIRLTQHGPVAEGSEAFARKVRSDLTQTIEVGHPSRRRRIPVSFYAKHYYGNGLRVPLAYAAKHDGPVVDERTPNHQFHHQFHGVLRPAQRQVCEKTMDALRSSSCATLVMPTGGGKTVCALYIAAVVKLKPIIFVHKSFLAQQWKERIQQYLPSVHVSTVQGTEGDFTGDIVIAMIQTFVSRQLEIPSCCGMVIVDEAHHIVANQFKHVILRGITNQRHVLALSATPNRKDGLKIQPLVGEIVTDEPRLPESIEGSVDDRRVLVKIVNYTHPSFSSCPPLTAAGDVSYTGMVSALVDLPERTSFLAKLVAEETDGRDTLVLSHRRQHCMDIAERLQRAGLDACLYIPGKGKHHPPPPTAKIVVSTFSYVSEGFDMPRLSCLVFATPASNLQQSVGRILRTPDPKSSPLVIDVADGWGLLNASTRKRRSFYHANGYVVATRHHHEPQPHAQHVAFIEED